MNDSFHDSVSVSVNCNSSDNIVAMSRISNVKEDTVVDSVIKILFDIMVFLSFISVTPNLYDFCDNKSLMIRLHHDSIAPLKLRLLERADLFGS